MQVESMVNQTELAAKIGVSPAMVSKYKKEGMPLDSIKNAFTWLERRKIGLKKKPKKMHGPGVVLESGSGDPNDARRRAIDAELACYRVLTDAIDGGDPSEVKTAAAAWRDAQKAVIESERLLLETQTKARTMIGLDEVNEVFNRHLGGIRQLMDALPASLAAKCNPADSDLAREVLEDGVAQIFAQITKAEGAFA